VRGEDRRTRITREARASITDSETPEWDEQLLREATLDGLPLPDGAEATEGDPSVRTRLLRNAGSALVAPRAALLLGRRYGHDATAFWFGSGRHRSRSACCRTRPQASEKQGLAGERPAVCVERTGVGDRVAVGDPQQAEPVDPWCP
jgi:hypothetical protein